MIAPCRSAMASVSSWEPESSTTISAKSASGSSTWSSQRPQSLVIRKTLTGSLPLASDTISTSRESKPELEAVHLPNHRQPRQFEAIGARQWQDRLARSHRRFKTGLTDHVD